MKFLIDAQLPRRVATLLNSAGHEAIHTLGLPHGNATPDTSISALADQESRIVITKDADFVSSHLIHGAPRQLLLISTGNIHNRALESLLLANLPALVIAFEQAVFVELGQSHLTIHH